MFAFQRGGAHYGVVQGCCNHWECARCGQMVAKKHYGRIVEGAREIHKQNKLVFITVTCRGLELSVDDAKTNYLKWTHRLLRTMQQKCVRRGGKWFYVQVTELQKRGHPHSHILTSFAPPDICEGVVPEYTTGNNGRIQVEYKDALRSDWLQEMVQKAGLGEQYDLSMVQTVEGAARYVAKYMFKDSQFGTHFPKGWKRVRYSQSWPNYERKKTDAFVLLTREDWYRLATVAAHVDTDGTDTFETCTHFLQGSDTIISMHKDA